MNTAGLRLGVEAKRPDVRHGLSCSFAIALCLVTSSYEQEHVSNSELLDNWEKEEDKMEE